jgi:hypothetical protein
MKVLKVYHLEETHLKKWAELWTLNIGWWSEIHTVLG